MGKSKARAIETLRSTMGHVGVPEPYRTAMTKAADQDAAPAGAGRTFRGVIPDTFLTAQANSEEEARQLMVAQLIDLLNRKPEDVIIVYE